MATECDVNRSRRFDRAMSRRTRRPTSLAASFQDQYVPPLITQHLHQDAKLKTLFQRQDSELHALKQCEEDADQQQQQQQRTPCLSEDEELKIPVVPQRYEGLEQKIIKQFQDEEQEKKPEEYQDEDQEKKPEEYQDEDQEKKPEEYQDEEQEKKPEEYQDEEQKTAQEHQDEKKTAEKCQDEEDRSIAKQCQEEGEEKSEQHQDEEHKAQQDDQSRGMEQKTLDDQQCQSVKKPTAPAPAPVDGMPRYSLQELIQEKQLVAGEAKSAGKFGYGENVNVLADRKVYGAATAAATGGATLAMVIKRPDGGKKSMGVIRRCVKALNQMMKAKHGSKKNLPFKEV